MVCSELVQLLLASPFVLPVSPSARRGGHVYVPDIFLCSVNYYTQRRNEYDEYINQGFFHKGCAEYYYKAVQYDKSSSDLCRTGSQISYFEFSGSTKS